MPPWLLALLQQHNSAGYADSLAQLMQWQPNYAQVQSTQGRKQLVGDIANDSQGRPVLNLTPYTQQHFGDTDWINQRGHQEPGVKLGDHWLGHESGHLVANGAGRNDALTAEIISNFPAAPESESFADNFSVTMNFLRTGKTDTSKLTDIQKKIMQSVLKYQPYENHPLNRASAITALTKSH